MSKVEKTNVMRILEQGKIPYVPHYFDPDSTENGVEVAAAIGKDASGVYKTLVTQNDHGEIFVFVIPVAAELNLKKAASTAKQKSLHMLAQKELLSKTGYIHGGCSPVGLKKPYPVFLDTSALSQETITVSAGKRGAQVEVQPEALLSFVHGTWGEFLVEV